MAQINVTEMLTDPDFVDKIQLVTRVPSVNSYGESKLVSTTVDTIGSVQPASGRTLARLPESLRLANVSSFWFKGTIVASAPGKYPSVLVFKGQRYQVQTVMDWTNWGEGWCEGTCVAEVPA